MDTNMDIYVHPDAVIDEGCYMGNDTRVYHFTHTYTWQTHVCREEIVQNRNLFNP